VIAFQTLFLGLVFGFGPVQVMVSPPVVSAEVFLDGVSLGTVRGAPWEVGCNFGASPLPHELVAVGRDTKGNEVARVRQWVNLPRPSAEARVLVEAGADGAPAFAHLAWHTIDNARPKRFDVTLDGHELPVKDPERIPLPRIDFKRPHFLAVEVVFPLGVVARAETSLGGDVAANAATELTAVDVVLRPGQTLPPVDAMQGWFTSGGRSLPVVGVEEGHTDAVVVFDQDSAGRFRGITPPNPFSRAMTTTIPIQPSKGGNRLYGLWTVPQRPQGGGAASPGLFPMSIPLDTDVDDVRTLIFRFSFPAAPPRQQQLANAVAAAGMQAAALNRRRAVVLIVGEAPADASTISVTAARAYLESLDVPLFIWTPERRIAGLALPGWGVPDDISTDLQLQGGVARLQNALAAQRIVWLEGSHLPQSIALAPGVTQVFLARGVVREARASR
jgi:hypothetical protein